MSFVNVDEWRLRSRWRANNNKQQSMHKWHQSTRRFMWFQEQKPGLCRKHTPQPDLDHQQRPQTRFCRAVHWVSRPGSKGNLVQRSYVSDKLSAVRRGVQRANLDLRDVAGIRDWSQTRLEGTSKGSATRRKGFKIRLAPEWTLKVCASNSYLQEGLEENNWVYRIKIHILDSVSRPGVL